MNRPIYALVCGTLRLEFEFYTTLTCLCELRKQGIIKGIVVSSWNKEEGNIPGIHDKLKKLNIEFVETTEPTLDFYYGEAIYLRQAVQLDAGLNVLPEDALVLKCRSDYSNFDINRMDVLWQKDIDWMAGKQGDFYTGKNLRTAVLRFGIGAPFAFHDICFMGCKADLKKSIYFDNTKLSFEKNIIADIWFFAGYYANRFRMIHDFYRYIKIDRFHSGMNHLMVLDETFELPDFLNKFYALYFLIIYTDFMIYHDRDLAEETVLRMEDIFYGNQNCGIRKDWVVEIRCFEVIRRIVEGRVEHSGGYANLYAEICSMKELQYAEKQRFTGRDFEELSIWGKKYFGYEPEEWLEPFYEIEPKETLQDSEPGFKGSAQILFSDYKMNDRVYEIVRDISFNKLSYYDTVISYLDELERVDDALYKKALFSSARYFDDKVLHKITELLLDGETKGKDIKEASFMFKRFVYDERLYCFPMSIDRIIALLNYSLYEEFQEGKSPVAGQLIQRLCKYFEIADFEIDESKLVRSLQLLLNKISCLDIMSGTINCDEKRITQNNVRTVLNEKKWGK